MQEAAQRLRDFVPTEESLHDPFPWSTLSPEQTSELYAQADPLGRATLIAGQVRLQCNLYNEGTTIHLFMRVLYLFGTVPRNEEEYSGIELQTQDLPDTLSPQCWAAPEPSLLRKARWMNDSYWEISLEIANLVGKQWECELAEATVAHLKKEISSNVETFMELVGDLYIDLPESIFRRTLREAFTTPRCTGRELMDVLEHKLRYWMNLERTHSKETKFKMSLKRIKEQRGIWFGSKQSARDASPERMDHKSKF